MPTVPRLTNPIQQSALPTSRARAQSDLDAFGGGQASQQFAHATQNLGSQVSQMVQQQRAAADDLASTNAKYALMSEKNRLMYDPKNGAITRKGSDAFGASNEYMPQFDKIASDLQNGLANDRQKAQFAQFRAQMRVDLDGDLMRHTFSESEKFSDETTKSALSTIKDDAVLNYSNPDKISNSIDQQKVLLIKEADRKGLPPEWVNLQLKQSASNIHSSVIERMLDNKEYPLAKEYFDRVKGDLTGADSNSTEKAMRTMKAQYEGENAAMGLMNTHGVTSTALQKAMGIDDQDVRREAVRFIKDNIDIKEMQKTEFEKANFKTASDAAEFSKDRPPNSVWKNLTMSQREAVDARIAQLKKGVAPSTDWQLYSDLKFMASQPDTREKFLQADPYMWRTKLADGEYKEIVKLYTDAKAGNTKELDLIGGQMQIVKQTLEENGINTKDEKAMGQFYRKFREQQELLQLRTGRKATDGEIQQIADNMLVEGIVSKNGEKQSSWLFFDKKKKVFQLEDGEQIEVDPGSVPASARKAIINSLKNKNIPASAINDKLIYDVYMKSQAGS